MLLESILSDFQLYVIIQNKKLDEEIRQCANEEFIKRKLSSTQLGALADRFDSEVSMDTSTSLKTGYKILILISPFLVVIHSLFAGRMLAKRKIRKWKQYWFCICLGFLLYTVAFLLIDIKRSANLIPINPIEDSVVSKTNTLPR